MDAWPLIFNHEPGLELVVNTRWETGHQENAWFMKEMVEHNRKNRRDAEEQHLLKKNRNNRKYEKFYLGKNVTKETEPVVCEYEGVNLWTAEEIQERIEMMRVMLNEYKAKYSGIYTYLP
jgi:hypothetical protein